MLANSSTSGAAEAARPLVSESAVRSRQHAGSQADGESRRLLPLTLTALGVVYGDIGTSPLYALRECFFGSHAVPPTHDNVLGVLSLIIYSLLLVISIKYVALVMRADNQGEGGVLALTALVPGRARGSSGVPRLADGRAVLIALGIFGTALLYGDGMITPAISVLGAVEGLEVVTPLFQPYVVPVTVVILVGLFLIQRYGTHRVGGLFGPVMVIWFVVLAVLGLVWIVRLPAVLGAFDPRHAIAFFRDNGFVGFTVLGAVFLVVTGGEALYADMGHFGRKPIRLAWFALVLPSLILNYLGQGALLLLEPGTDHPFFLLAPSWALLPLVGLATAAAIIASQALISGSFSITRQAIQLGLAPRLEVEHTSAREMGQIYVPQVNWALMFATLIIVIGFGSSTALAAAYGIAVTLDHGHHRATALCRDDRTVALAPGGSHRRDGGLPGHRPRLLWRQRAEDHAGRLGDAGCGAGVVHPDDDVEDRAPAGGRAPDRARRPARRLHRQRDRTAARARPGDGRVHDRAAHGHAPALAHNLRYNKVLHQHVIVLTVSTAQQPHVAPEDRITVEPLGARPVQRPVAVRVHGGSRCPRGAQAGADAGSRTRSRRSHLLPGP